MFVLLTVEGAEDMLGSTGSRAARASKAVTRVLGVALIFRGLFLAGLTLALSYATVLLIVIHLYRKGYGVAGKIEQLAFRFAAAGLGCARAENAK